MTDIILLNADIIPMDSRYQGGKLIALRNGRIEAVAGVNALEDFKRKGTTVIDCTGKTVVPGFIDTHLHLRTFAESFITLRLSPRDRVRAISDIQAKVRLLAQKLPPGSWIRGKEYDEFYCAEKRHPNRRDLDKVAPAHPVKLTHRSGHCHVLNSLALQHVGISKDTPDPPGGFIDRDISTGEPTGLLYDMGDILSKRVPPLDKQRLEEGVQRASEQLLSVGITSLQDATFTNNHGHWKDFCKWKKDGLLKPRITMMLGAECIDHYCSDQFSVPYDETHLRLNGIKLMVTESTGRLHPPQSELNNVVAHAHQQGLQVAIHAVEEGHIESACSAIAYALQLFPRTDHRHRIEHCSVCPPALARRLAHLGITVVTQPPFVFYHGDRYLTAVPANRLPYLYPMQTLLKAGLRVAASSDCPVAPPSPLVGVYSAVSRMSQTGHVITPRERISPLEALRMYTLSAAQTVFEETIKGSITPGKIADLVILSGNPATVPLDRAEEIKDMQVEMTILDGKVVWHKRG